MEITMTGKYMTRDGKVVRILATDMKSGDASIIGLVTTKSGTEEYPQCWRANGRSLELGVDESPEDLSLLVTRHKGWCVVRNNMWWDGSTFVRPTPEAAWADKELADKRNPNEEHRIAQVYWES